MARLGKNPVKAELNDYECPRCGQDDTEAESEYSDNSWVRNIKCLNCGCEFSVKEVTMGGDWAKRSERKIRSI